MGNIAAQAAMAALQMIQARQQAKARYAAASGEAQSRIQQIQQAQQIRERQRREQLRQNLARQRARFGATGVGGGGSSEAVLRGLTNQAERDIADQRGNADLALDGIRSGLQQRRRMNLLEASAQRRRTAFSLLKNGLDTVSLLER